MTRPSLSSYPTAYYEDVHLSEKDKSSKEYLQASMNHWVSSLVHDKSYMKTYRDYYNGVRNNKDFEYLTDNYGIGTPTALKFTNIIKPRVDSLVSQITDDNFTYTVSCTDDKTLDLIQEEKKNKKLKEINEALDSFSNSILSSKKSITQSDYRSNLARITKKYETNYLSDFEVAAQKVCSYFERSNELGIRQKLITLATDLIVVGECYWRVYFTKYGSDPKLEIIKPENFFHNKSTNTPFLDTTDAVVRREYLTHKEVVRKFGKFLSKDDLTEMFGDRYMTMSSRNLNSGLDLELYYGEDNPQLQDRHYSTAYTVETLHIEWKVTNESDLDDEERASYQTIDSGFNNEPKSTSRREDLYEGTRIGGKWFVNCGKVENTPRSSNDPEAVEFTYGGICNNDRAGKPFSIVGSLKDIQDTYDLIIFYRDNLVANSGVSGDRINLAGIPKALGNNFMDRLFKFIALKKNGVELIDPTEPGAQLFQHYGSFNNTLDGRAVDSIESLLRFIEHQADIAAGTTQQMLGQIAEREAIGNVKIGLHQSLLINQVLFGLFRSAHTNVMSKLLKSSQVSYQEGKKISYVAGTESYVFGILPEKFSYTDYALSIGYASKDTQKLLELKALAKELVSNQMVDPDVITKIMLSDSITEIQRLITQNWLEKKEESMGLSKANSIIEQMEDQIKQLEGELTNAKQQLEASTGGDKGLKIKELELKQFEIERKLEIEGKKVKDANDYQDKKIDLDKERVQLEREQLYLGTGPEREVRNS
jgi:hypothetical protein